jgi:hypothetical protein
MIPAAAAARQVARSTPSLAICCAAVKKEQPA